MEYPLSDYAEALKWLICNEPSEECYLGSCQNCPGGDALCNYIVGALQDHDIDKVYYKQWIFKPRTTLGTCDDEPIEFAQEFCEKLENLLTHDFIARQQASFIKSLKESLQDGQFLVICDFAENYAFVIQNAAPGFHWNNNSVTIYPVVIYYQRNDSIVHQSLVIMSDSLAHDAVAVFVFSKIINEFIKSICESPEKVFYFSDGAPQQFKNFKNLINVYNHQNDFGVPAEWHYFASAHGKGPCDGVGGTVKRLAARASLQLPPDRQITTAEELYSWANDPAHLPNISVRYSPGQDYRAALDFLATRFDGATSLPATQKIHCFIPADDGNVVVKRFSNSNKGAVLNILKKPGQSRQKKMGDKHDPQSATDEGRDNTRPKRRSR